MYHLRFTGMDSPRMYHGYSTHALLTLKLGHCPWAILFIYVFIYLLKVFLVRKLYSQNATSLTCMSRFKNHLYDVPHLACAWRGDLAIFGDLATINIFDKKLSCI